MRKIIYICIVQLFPIQTGGAQVTHQYLKELNKENEVILITVKANDEKAKMIIGKNIRIIDIFNKNSIKKFLSPFTYLETLSLVNKFKPDLILIDYPWFGLIGIIANFLFKTPFYIRSHNVEFKRMQRLNRWYWRVLKIYEKIVYENAEKIICISELDKKSLIQDLKISSKKIRVLGYIPDQKNFKKNIKARKMVRKLLNIENDFVILFFGPLDYKPNIEAVNIIENEIAPNALKHNKNIKFLIAGRNPSNLKSKNSIIFTGYVERIEDYINASDLVIIPLISGGGIRTKILEALACGKKVITTKIGIEGITIFEKNIIISNNIDEFNMFLLKSL